MAANVFAYSVQTACDKNGWILGYSVNPGNQHDSRTFKSLYDKIKDIGIQTQVADAGYKTPAIAKLLLDDGITPLLPYKRPMTKDGFFKKKKPSMCMMNILTAMYARMIRCWLIIRRTVPDTGNTRAAESSVKDVHI